MLPEVSERITVAVIDGGFADLQCACDLFRGNSGELAREDRDVLFAAMRLCKIRAAGESEPVNQALRHRPVVGQILFFDLLMYAPGPAVGFRCEMDRPKEETQNGTGFGRVEFRWLLPRAPTSIETVQTSCNRSSTANGSTRNASQPITTGAYMRYKRSNDPSTDMAPRIRAETIPCSGGSCCSSPISRALTSISTMSRFRIFRRASAGSAHEISYRCLLQTAGFDSPPTNSERGYMWRRRTGPEDPEESGQSSFCGSHIRA